MNGLIIDLYLDEDVDVLVADLVRARGFTVVTTQEAGNVGASDQQQLAAAVSMRHTFVTHNRIDFELLAEEYFASGQDHCGILTLTAGRGSGRSRWRDAPEHNTPPAQQSSRRSRPR
jgi:Domain of unknown function (DUF5615)